ncbi:DNA adenine methylase [Beggiatoa leptomitoformis]|uniref:Site-specific DNA-methyltransferase (adenine-specific) n=1 Tax=Beggiatoa leptomitoformis TaxID=288004 RepID=A0A2N9YGH4_9GAMM|nr:Dam family site-specific DNA-(adenine-N6)-methyltransferase [Beggiatoa leptomitoformis]ALG68084.1 Dam family site-specific DNA-(adenine-N6)-methyltransferase [Beggiatoa leptomitoformis]AUI69622.1 Dam family site-specific DNA-(adenine-N6)-methyltransferase [Beggiatoa leptomitoformis]
MTNKHSATASHIKPFIKWVGGKRGLLDELLKRLPQHFNHYFEPFVGGGALFFELRKRGVLTGKNTYLFDKNAELINAYQTVQQNPDALITQLQHFQEQHSAEFYSDIRALDRQSTFASLTTEMRAARFIYLNKTCFNGLYRVNKQGFYNVPMGNYAKPAICDAELLLSAHQALIGVTVLHADYSHVAQLAKKNDFIYFDPPYYPLSTTSNFTAYNQHLFLDEQQKQLFNLFKQLDNSDCLLMHSNSDTPFMRELYKIYYTDTVQMHRFINSKKEGRGKINEVIIRNYQ